LNLLVNVDGFQSSAVFTHLQGVVAQQAAQLQKDIGGTFRFDVKSANGEKSASWLVAVPTSGECRVAVVDATTTKADCVLTMDDETLVGVMTGKTNPQVFFCC
jgi:putative sterol carrier protein